MTHGAAHGQAPSRARRGALVLALLLTLMSLIQGDHRARKGRNALLKWAPAQEALDRGEPIYEVGAEGYPTLPVTLLLMRPFHLAGPRLGPFLWAACKLALAWWLVLGALGLAFGSPSRAPTWVLWVTLLLSFRVLHSDVQHGNLNLVVGAVAFGGVTLAARGRELAAGAAFGLGTALKVTPALGLVWLLARGSRRGPLGFLGGLAAGLLAPAAWLGLGRTLDLTGAWTRQMLVPYVQGRELTLLQTEHINQSLLGVLARHLTDAVAIPARPRGPAEPLRLGWLDLSPEAFRMVHGGACLALLGAFLWVTWRSARAERGARGRQVRVLGSGALLGLAMVLLSERSWKHHHVLLPVTVVFLAWCAANRRTLGPAIGRAGWLLLGVVTVAFAGTGEAVLGPWGSDLAEALGAQGLGDLVLFVGLGWLLVNPALTGDPTHADTQVGLS